MGSDIFLKCCLFFVFNSVKIGQDLLNINEVAVELPP